jgi:hypothetical protein
MLRPPEWSSCFGSIISATLFKAYQLHFAAAAAVVVKMMEVALLPQAANDCAVVTKSAKQKARI